MSSEEASMPTAGDDNAARRAKRRERASIGSKPLLSVDEAALLMGETRSTLYRAIRAGTLPLPVHLIGRRLKIPRRAVERLLEGAFGPEAPAAYEPRVEREEVAGVRRRPTCSAARWSSADRPSV